nr:FAD-dependent oxidoreductase [Tenuibacillus multivorans]
MGGGLGGCAAAMAACERGLSVLMTEETDWIGGQVTSQGVPPDEHPYMESFGRTRRYQAYRQRVREKYLDKLDVQQIDTPFNPGNGLVSHICHDPRVSLHVLNDMLLKYTLTNQLMIHTNCQLHRAIRTENRVKEAIFTDMRMNTYLKVEAPFVMDATEEGELLSKAQLDYSTGAESKHETGECHALENADRNNVQALTYVLGMEYRKGEQHTINKPEMYDFWKAYRPNFWPDQYLSLKAPNPVTLEPRKYTLFKEDEGFPLWEYRRIYSQSLYHTVYPAGDVSLMNWPMNDYFLGKIFDVSDQEREKHVEQSKQLSLSLLYWLQTEARRPDGGQGYPGLKLRHDLFDTHDGLAKYPYVRESRRIKAMYTITEQDLSPESQPLKSGVKYDDRIGIGYYRIDLHPSTGGRNYLDIPTLPFHIPLGALIPKDMDNVLAGCKNIGTTHITNGCYRLHPVEWNVGEAGGAIVAFCLNHQVSPKEVREEDSLLKRFQRELREDGLELEWPREFYEEQT